jgi:hypothetical protein
MVKYVTSTLELFFRQQVLLKNRGHMLPPQNGTEPIKLGVTGLTGQVL